MRTFLVVLGFALLLPAAASAGGFATAGVLNPPEGIDPGETWTAQIEILQHGRTPMTGIEPAVVVGGERFPAAPTDKPGIYTAEVIFDKAGRIDYRVDDGFTNAEPHTFVAVIGETTAATTAPAAAADDFPWMPILAGVFGALGLAVLLSSRRGGRTVPA